MSPQPFAHLQAGETVLWDAWLQLHAAEYDRFDYDVRVGKGADIDPSRPAYIQKMARKVSPKRIDAVGYVGTVPTTFVIMRTARRAAFGACLLYPRLYMATFNYRGPIHSALVTHLVDNDIRGELEREGCAIYVLPMPETEP